MVPVTDTRKGFTLIELLTSIGILGILLVLLMANFQRGGLVGDLRTSSQTLAGHIRKMQTIATSGQTITLLGSEIVPPGGYGIHFFLVAEIIPPNPPVILPVTSYRTFADIARVRTVGSCIALTPSDDDGAYNAGCDRELEVFSFRPLVQITRFQVDEETPIELDNIPGSGLNIAFKPPKPTPIITAVSAGGSSADPEEARYKRVRIELYHERAHAYRTISVNGASGQISETAGCIEEVRAVEGYPSAACGSSSP